MTAKEKATQFHNSGCNCAQSVLCAVCDDYGVDEKTAYQMATFFGAGMRRGEVCGAVTGALMALGLKYGDENNRQKRNSVEFMIRFKEEFGSYVCRELLPDDMKKSELCPYLIEWAADYLDKDGLGK